MKMMLRTKVTLLLVITSSITCVISLILAGSMLSNQVEKSYIKRANELAGAIALGMDADQAQELRDAVVEIYESTDEKVTSDDWGTPEFETYLENYKSVESMECFQNLRAQLRRFQDSADVDCMYLIYVDPKSKYAVYLMDAAYEDACPPGVIDTLYATQNLSFNERDGFSAYVTNTEAYGHLVTAGMPILDAKGNVICQAFVDISMDDVISEQRNLIALFATIMILTTIIIGICLLLYANHTMVKPLKKLSDAALSFCDQDGEILHPEFSDLNVHTGDEIEVLAQSMKKMELDIKEHITKLDKARSELNSPRVQAATLNRMNNKDTLTNLGNKIAYSLEVDRLEKEMQTPGARFGLAVVDMNGLKDINENYGHERGNLAVANLARTIEGIFQHSMIFRTEGDEFVIVLRDEDYTEIREIQSRFFHMVAIMHGDSTLKPWENFSAAFGYALYNPELDHSIDSVFQRAMREMEKCKAYQKEKEKSRK